ncbi:HNH endonuclease signature motif containing protein [Mycobacterium sp. NPDC006124]|uniref:HNH endonuclease signature motif containing protein n=1 Tax=Mycobacterium sp. NPDC006124 TaxID=3156729 RepID=UPI0033BF4AF1
MPPTDERAALDGDHPPLFDKPLRDLTLTEALTPTPGTLANLRPAALMGGQFLPGAIACRATIGATITPIMHPGQASPENRCRPSKKLADFIRCRDMTCRFPGCRAPATNCDVDHTIPWPNGPTTASNLKCPCRRHHLLKTFWGGENGWRDGQLDDGTIIWTAPDGQEFITTPGSRLLFPELSRSTATVTATGRPTPHTAGLTMPRRATTRAEDRAARVTHEREANEQCTRTGGPEP